MLFGALQERSKKETRNLRTLQVARKLTPERRRGHGEGGWQLGKAGDMVVDGTVC
jgi:hypothetical protein